MIRTLLVFFLLICALSVQAQNNFRKGYVITNEQDTLRGYINYREGLRNYLECVFRQAPESNSVRYHANEIAGYRFENDKFIVSRKLELEESSDEWYFLEVLVTGSLTLYQYRDRFFVGRSDTVETELTNEVRDVIIDGRRMRQETGKFRGILLYLTQDCPAVKSRIENALLIQKELTQIVEEYNECVGKTVSYKSNKPWFKAVPAITAGITSTLFSYDNVSQVPGSFSNDLTYTFGLDVELNSPRVHEFISFYGGIFFVQNQFTSYVEDIRFNSIYRHDITATFSQIKLPLAIRYTFQSRGIIPFFNVGIVPAILDVSDNTWRTEVQRNSIVYTDEKTPFNLAKRNLGLMGGIGLKKKLGNKLHLRTEFRYEVFRKLYNDPALNKDKIANYQILISISL